MKLKFTLLLIVVAFGMNAQKQLQPYNYSVTEDGKTETIMIYASAEAVNSITFTLKNEKNETLKSKEENKEAEDIKFKVFPFTETSFRKNLVDAINSIQEKDETNKEYGLFDNILAPLNKTEDEIKDLKVKDKVEQQSKRKDAVQDVRNIFQFFEALTITAFQYDTEPVAGILKYEQSVIIEKQNINGLDTETYFETQTKFIQKLIINAHGDREEFLKSVSFKQKNDSDSKGDDFLMFLAKGIKIKDEDERIFQNDYEGRLESEIQCIKNNNNELKLKNDLIIEKEARLNLSTLRRCKENTYVNKTEDSLNNKGVEKHIERLQKKQLDFNTQLEKLTSDHKNDIAKIKKDLNNQIEDLKNSGDTLELNIEESYLVNLFDYYQNIKNNSKAESILEIHINTQLKDWYNIYELEKFTKGDFANNYFKEKYRKTLNEEILVEFSNLMSVSKISIEKFNKNIEISNKSIDSLTALITKNDLDIKTTYVNKNPEARDSYFKPKDTLLRKQISQLDSVKLNFNTRISRINKAIEKYKILKKPFEENTKLYQNKINFLIAKRKNQIVNIPWWRFNVSNIEIDFNDGFIEHITVIGKTVTPEIDRIAILNSIKKRHEQYYTDVNLEKAFQGFYDEPYVIDALKDVINKEYKFDNEFPIGFSSKSDFADLSGYNLYAFEGSTKVFSLPLTNVINIYIQRHQNDRLDFSPKDQVLTLPLDDPNNVKQVELKKETSSKILNAKIFTDFNGLQESKPNGLVQIEIEKQIPLWTKRRPLGLGRSSNIGYFNYSIFNLTWAKLNEEDRELQVNYAESFVNNQPQTDKYVTYLDLIKYENVSIGVDLNIASLDFPLVKTRLEINAGIHYGRIKVVDKVTTTDDENMEIPTTVLDEDINMIRWYPDFIVRIRPEERFGGYLRYRPFRTIVPNTDEDFFAVGSAENFEEHRTLAKSWLQRFELGAFYTPSAESDNKFFFRYRYTNNFKMETNGYSEIQLGYQIYLKF